MPWQCSSVYMASWRQKPRWQSTSLPELSWTQTWRNKGFLLPLHSFEWFRIEKQMFHIMLLHHMCWCEIFLHTVATLWSTSHHLDFELCLFWLFVPLFSLPDLFCVFSLSVCLFQCHFLWTPVNHSAASSKPCSSSHSPPAGSGLLRGYICLMAQPPSCLAPDSIFKHQPFFFLWLAVCCHYQAWGGACSPSASAGFSPGSTASFLIPKTCTLGGFKWTPNCL